MSGKLVTEWTTFTIAPGFSRVDFAPELQAAGFPEWITIPTPLARLQLEDLVRQFAMLDEGETIIPFDRNQ